MSDRREVDQVMTLEDLFKSEEFGRPRAVHTARGGHSPYSPRGPLVPVATTAVSGAVRHDTTTHRRNRTVFAAVSGVAAALLVAVGVFAQSGTPSRSQPNEAAGNGGNGSSTIIGGFKLGDSGSPTGNRTAPTSIGTASGPGSGGGAAVTLASVVKGTTPNNPNNPTKIVVVCTGCGHPTGPGGGGGGTSGGGGTTTPPPSSSGSNVLSPVTTLVGHVVQTVGATATTAAIGLTVTAPPLSPVTGLVAGLGGTVTGLGNMVIGI